MTADEVGNHGFHFFVLCVYRINHGIRALRVATKPGECEVQFLT